MNPGTRNAVVKNTASKDVKVIAEALSLGFYRHLGGTFNVTRSIQSSRKQPI
jgi:hypothetical protein